MQVFKTFFKILMKQLVSIILYGAIFLGITILVVYLITGNNEDQFSIQKAPIIAVNMDGDNDFINGFLNYLDRYVEYVEEGDNEDARKDALFFEKVCYILTIPEGFAEDFLAGRDPSLMKETLPDARALSVDNAINNYLNQAKIYLEYLPDTDAMTLNSYILKSLKVDTQVSLDASREDKIQRSVDFYNYYYNYLAYILLAVFITGISNVMYSFNGLDIRRRQGASPLSGRSMSFQLIYANFVFIIIYLTFFVIAGVICNPFKEKDVSLIIYILNALIFALVALSFSYLIGITVKSRNAIQALATALSLSLSFLSGIFVDQDMLGDAVLKVSSFTPTYWFVRANDEIAHLSGYNLDKLRPILGYMGIEIGFAAAIIGIALVVSKRKRVQAI